MKKFLLFFLISSQVFSQVIKKQVSLESPNAKSFIWNTGVFNQDLRVNNTPGFEWPKNSGKFACFTSGLTIACIINGNIRTASAYCNGEYCPGYIIDSAGFQKARTDSSFRHYKVTKGNVSSYDYLNWGKMVPYGAPFVDANNNGLFEPFIDTPGVKNALETVFICLTDGFPENHSSSEGLAGGTKPINAEVHLTAWTYPYTQTQDVQFFKWEIINKNDSDWTKCYFSCAVDSDLGDADDDYNGCDTTLRLGYQYNRDNNDGTGSGRTYGLNPPAFGLLTLKSPMKEINVPLNFYFNMYFKYPAPCDYEGSTPTVTYNWIRGYKKDGSNNLDPTYSPPKPTRVCFPGNPETGEGWTCYSGRILNCGGLDTGTVQPVSFHPRSFFMSFGNDNYTFRKGSTNSIILAQLIARGANNLNSVTKLKELSAYVKEFYNNNYTIGIKKIENEIPSGFSLQQNYPNPFNPNTKITFSLSKGKAVSLNLYDSNGRLVKSLHKGYLSSGVYAYELYEPSLSSGVYFYSLVSDEITLTKKMMLVK